MRKTSPSGALATATLLASVAAACRAPAPEAPPKPKIDLSIVDSKLFVTDDEDAEVRVALIAGLAAASGAGGMAGGQMHDIAAEKRTLQADAIRELQAMKTGALFRYACEAGAILGRADAEERGRLAAFGAALAHEQRPSER